MNGFVSDEGRKCGIATPFCDAASALVRSKGVGQVEPEPMNLVRVVESMPAEKQDEIEAFRQACVEVVGEEAHAMARL